jgi:hypothetical protein
VVRVVMSSMRVVTTTGRSKLEDIFGTTPRYGWPGPLARRDCRINEGDALRCGGFGQRCRH